MADLPLDVGNHLAGIDFIPAPIEILGHRPKLDDEVTGQVLWLNLTPLLALEPKERLLIVTHDDTGVRAADESSACPPIFRCFLYHCTLICLPPLSSPQVWSIGTVYK